MNKYLKHVYSIIPPDCLHQIEGEEHRTLLSEDEVEFVKRIEERCLDIFACRSKLTKAKIKKNWDRKDWWISAEEAKELKLVDEIRARMPENKPNKKR